MSTDLKYYQINNGPNRSELYEARKNIGKVVSFEVSISDEYGYSYANRRRLPNVQIVSLKPIRSTTILVVGGYLKNIEGFRYTPFVAAYDTEIQGGILALRS